jgi:hypothetical protein
MKRSLIAVFLAMLLAAVGCDLRYGFVESRFQLAKESRLPKWFSMPAGYSRQDVRVVLTFYTHPISEDKVIAVLYGPPPENKKLGEFIGTRRVHPITQREHEKGQFAVYPSYLIITVNNISEIFEHRRKGDILYVVDTNKIQNNR